jgi:hypothetical protein
MDMPDKVTVGVSISIASAGTERAAANRLKVKTKIERFLVTSLRVLILLFLG